MTEQQALDDVFGAAGPITGVATDADGSVTVEVGAGGVLRSVRVDQRALRYGARYLAETVLTTAAKATARANRRAHQLYAQALGGRGDQYADKLGLTYDPALADQPDGSRRAGQARRPRPVMDDDRDDYPETWLR